MILLLGATGYLGRAFADELRKRGWPFTPLTRQAVDYTRFNTLFKYVRHTRPDFVINAAGYTGRPDTAACDTHRADTIKANTLLPQTVARVCYLANVPWGHVSSGNVYSGAKLDRNGARRTESDLSRPELLEIIRTRPAALLGFTEQDEPNCSFRSPHYTFYSGSKALAEEGLRFFQQGYIWRPGPVFDGLDHPRNFLSGFRDHRPIPDGAWSISHRPEFVGACLDLYQKKAPFGTYHIVNPDTVTSRLITETADRLPAGGAPAATARAPLSRSAENELLGSQCILDSSKLAAAGIRLSSAREAIANAFAHWHSAEPGQEWPKSSAFPEPPLPLNK